jgi:hypothetical protein
MQGTPLPSPLAAAACPMVCVQQRAGSQAHHLGWAAPSAQITLLQTASTAQAPSPTNMLSCIILCSTCALWPVSHALRQPGWSSPGAVPAATVANASDARVTGA